MTGKNPFLSLYLKGANKAAGVVRSAAMAEAGRQRTKMVREATKFWTGAWLGTAKKPRKR